MQLLTACAVLLISGTIAASDEKPAFKVIEVRQTGGFAGVEIDYRITPDGKFTRKSRRGVVEGKLSAEQSQALSKAVAAIDWEKLPEKLRATNVADDFIYEMHFIIGDKTHQVVADGISAGKNEFLKPILKTLVEVQRVPACRPHLCSSGVFVTEGAAEGSQQAKSVRV
ncbi:MAG: hypothetical protein RIC55_37070 [Pirellulaceae bacterium]